MLLCLTFQPINHVNGDNDSKPVNMDILFTDDPSATLVLLKEIIQSVESLNTGDSKFVSGCVSIIVLLIFVQVLFKIWKKRNGST